MVQGTDGNFYGVTHAGGAGWNPPSEFGNGTVFKMNPDGAVTRVAFFPLSRQSGSYAATLMQGSDGKFYGTKTDGGAYDRVRGLLAVNQSSNSSSVSTDSRTSSGISTVAGCDFIIFECTGSPDKRKPKEREIA